jgi:hypothetical protein
MRFSPLRAVVFSAFRAESFASLAMEGEFQNIAVADPAVERFGRPSEVWEGIGHGRRIT